MGEACGVDELIVLPEVAGTSYEDYEAVDIVKRVMEVRERHARAHGHDHDRHRRARLHAIPPF